MYYEGQMHGNNGFVFLFLPRSLNGVAHYIVREAFSGSLPLNWVSMPSSHLLSILSRPVVSQVFVVVFVLKRKKMKDKCHHTKKQDLAWLSLYVYIYIYTWSDAYVCFSGQFLALYEKIFPARKLVDKGVERIRTVRTKPSPYIYIYIE